jgi:hypothetical protein
MSVFSTDEDNLKGLVETLNGYYDKTRTGKSTGLDYQQATNALRESYDKSHLGQEAKTDIAKKLKYYAQNAGRSLTNDGPSVIGAIKESGGFAKKLGQSGFAKLLPMLGMGAVAAGVATIANKVKDGNFGEAASDAADMATDYIPGIGMAKTLLKPSEAGEYESADSFDNPENPQFKQRLAALKKLREREGIN